MLSTPTSISLSLIYLIIIKQVEYKLRQLGLKFDPRRLNSFEDWFKEITQETEETVARSVYDPDGLNSIASMIQKRVDTIAIFESGELLLDMAKSSGGHVRHMMQMMRDACIQALGRGRSKIKADNITYAAKQLQFRFERATPRTHYAELARIAIQKELTEDSIGQELLFSTAVLEYNEDNRWVYPHPVVRRSELFQRALEGIQS